jgi:hypothetical protein
VFQGPTLSVLVTRQLVFPRATYRQCTMERNPHQACPGFMVDLELYFADGKMVGSRFCGPAAPAPDHEATFVGFRDSSASVVLRSLSRMSSPTSLPYQRTISWASACNLGIFNDNDAFMGPSQRVSRVRCM